MKSVSSLIERRLGSSLVPDEKPAASHTITWTPVIEKSPNCRPKLRTGLWGEIDGHPVVTVEETGDGWKWYFSPDRWPHPEDSFGYAPTRDRAREIADGKWFREHKPKTKRSASKKTEGLYKNTVLALALQSVFFLGLILLTAVALSYVILPLQTRVVQTMQKLAHLFGG